MIVFFFFVCIINTLLVKGQPPPVISCLVEYTFRAASENPEIVGECGKAPTNRSHTHTPEDQDKSHYLRRFLMT